MQALGAYWPSPGHQSHPASAPFSPLTNPRDRRHTWRIRRDARRRNHITRYRLLEQPRPVGGVPFFRFEHRDKVFVAKLILRAESLNVLFKGGVLLLIHVARIPLVRSRNRERTPVNEDAELRVLIPLRNFEFAQPFPSRHGNDP